MLDINRVHSYTYEIKIYCGLRQGYSKELPIYDLEDVSDVCQAYCDEKGFCVTVSPTEFIYKDGFEPGAVIGIINYPRFPNTIDELRARALELGKILLKEMDQERLSIVMPRETIMLERKNG